MPSMTKFYVNKISIGVTNVLLNLHLNQFSFIVLRVANIETVVIPVYKFVLFQLCGVKGYMCKKSVAAVIQSINITTSNPVTTTKKHTSIICIYTSLSYVDKLTEKQRDFKKFYIFRHIQHTPITNNNNNFHPHPTPAQILTVIPIFIFCAYVYFVSHF